VVEPFGGHPSTIVAHEEPRSKLAYENSSCV
jgi:hypothetical protein